MHGPHRMATIGCCFLVGFWLLIASPVGIAQPPGSTSFEQYDPGIARPSQYYDTPLREVAPLRRTRTQQEQVTVLIKQGKKIYCAWSNQLLHNDVSFKDVPPNQAEKFYDDGTHNDEIPFDGLPSNVDRDNYTYIGPYALLICLELELLKNRILTLDNIDRYKVNQWEAERKFDPLRFYSGLHATSLDGKTTLPKFSEKLTDLTDYIEILDQDVIEQFRGYKPYADHEYPEHQRTSLANFPRINDDLQTFEELPEYAQEYWRWVHENRPKAPPRRALRGFFGPDSGPYPGMGGYGGPPGGIY